MARPALVLVAGATLPEAQTIVPYSQAPGGQGLDGMYTDKPSYYPNETLRVHANWGNGAVAPAPGQRVQYRIRKVHGWTSTEPVPATGFELTDGPASPNIPFPPVDGLWETVYVTAGTTEDPYQEYREQQVPPFGSFVHEFTTENVEPSALPLDLSGLSEFTIEAWIYPTQVLGDAVVIAGQGECVACTPGYDPVTGDNGTFVTRGAYLGITEEGYLTAVVNAIDPDEPSAQIQIVTDAQNDVVLGQMTPQLEPNRWYYVAAVFSQGVLSIVQNPCEENAPGDFSAESECSCLCEEMCAIDAGGSGLLVDQLGLPFRVGARAEAPQATIPYNINGCFDGRIDRVALWSRALTLDELNRQMDAGGTDCTPSGGPLPLSDPDLQLFLDFEEPNLLSEHVEDSGEFLRVARDSSNYKRHGLVFNHGTPGVAGRPLTEKGLRINSDQVMDAGYDEVVFELDLSDVLLSQTDKSGMYVVQAVLEEAGVGFDPASAANQAADRFVTFIVKPLPSTPSPKGVAMIVPTMTWLAYNRWPGADRSDSPDITSNDLYVLSGLEPRVRGGVLQAPGANSVYTPGIGGAQFFMGWRRPALKASPVLDFGPRLRDLSAGPGNPARLDPENPIVDNANGVYMDLRALGWLTDPDGLGTYESYRPHVFSDFDLHLDSADNVIEVLDPARYDVVVLVGHPEYWSLEMLLQLHDFAEAGGSILSLGGNSIVYRSEAMAVPSTTGSSSSEDGLVLEANWWPKFKMLGPADARSVMYPDDGIPENEEPEGRIGVWRFLEMTYPAGSNETRPGIGGYRDYILGTLVDSGGISQGGFQADDCPSGFDVEQFGFWKLAEQGPDAHWLLDDTPLAIGSLLTGGGLVLDGVGHVVGNETDRFVCHDELYATLMMPVLALECGSAAWTLLHGSPPNVWPPVEFCPGPDIDFVLANPGPDPNFPYKYLPASNVPVQFPYSDTGQVAVLARGTGYLEGCNYNQILWCSQWHTVTEATELFEVATQPGSTNEANCYNRVADFQDHDGHGHVVYYKHRGGGRVLTVSAIDTPRGLVAHPPGMAEASSPLRILVKEALDCMIGGDCGDTHLIDICPQSVALPPYQAFGDDGSGQLVPLVALPVDEPGSPVTEPLIARGDLLVSEVMTDPLGPGASNGEWIEFVNTTDRALDLQGLELVVDGISVPIVQSTPVGIGGAVVLIKSGDPLQNGGVPGVGSTAFVRLPTSIPILENGLVELRNGETVVTRLAYEGSSPWPSSASGVSLSLIPGSLVPGVDDDLACEGECPSNWCRNPSAPLYGSDGNRGTPGSPNAACP